MNPTISPTNSRMSVVDALRGFALMAIVLLHSTSQTNAEILDELLTKWEEMGYTFSPLSELTESGM